MKIPFVDLKLQYQHLKDEMVPVVTKVMEEAAFIGGRELRELEETFAAYCGVPHGIAASSGTTALHLALFGVGVKPGDAVVTVPNTFIATAEAISHCGAEPVFVDVREDSLCMDPGDLERYIAGCEKRPDGTVVDSRTGRKVAAVLPVHLFGQMVDMKTLQEVLKGSQVAVIEDCAQAHGAEHNGQRAGSSGDAAAFSFFPGKNLGAYGDGGMVVTKSEDLARRLKMLSNHGRAKKYEHDLIGFNYRMDNLQAAVVLVKLRHLEAWNELRRAHAATYRRLLRESELTTENGGPVMLPEECPACRHVYHLFVIRISDRDNLQRHLSEQGIATGIHYPVPLHIQPAYQSLGGKRGQFPVSEKAAAQMLSLPMFPELTEAQISFVVEAICDYYKNK